MEPQFKVGQAIRDPLGRLTVVRRAWKTISMGFAYVLDSDPSWRWLEYELREANAEAEFRDEVSA